MEGAACPPCVTNPCKLLEPNKLNENRIEYYFSVDASLIRIQSGIKPPGLSIAGFPAEIPFTSRFCFVNRNLHISEAYAKIGFVRKKKSRPRSRRTGTATQICAVKRTA